MLPLDQHLCFAVYSTMHMFNRVYGPHLERLGLTYPQYLVMCVLWREGAQSVGSLAQRLKLESSTITPLVKRLESRELLHRCRDVNDERVVNVALTAAGRKLAAKVPSLNQAIASAIGLKASEQELLLRQIAIVRENLELAGR